MNTKTIAIAVLLAAVVGCGRSKDDQRDVQNKLYDQQEKNAKLQAELAAANVQITTLTSRVATLEASLATANKRTEEVTDVVKVLQADIDRLAPDAARERIVPIEVAYSKPMLGTGLVVVFRNTSAKPLTLNVRFTNPSLNVSKIIRVEVPAQLTSQVGRMEGWAAALGDQIDIACEGYDPAKFILR